MQNAISLYIHIPWCIRKCPYCDFNSHQKSGEIEEKTYIDSLLQDFKIDITNFPISQINTIFIGGGTPSLFSAKSFEYLLNSIEKLIPFAQNIEITLEANPGTVEHHRFVDYFSIGVNRISLGIQSFNKKYLKILGRIHDENEAYLAIENVKKAGFENFNLDLMYGLPGQSAKEGEDDLHTAIKQEPKHISWYQLTIEPNTIFYKQKPQLPKEKTINVLEDIGYQLLKDHSFKRYEISAFAQNGFEAKHNLNYWLYGDYLGIGAGAHGKYTDHLSKKIIRTQKHKLPKEYLNTAKNFQTKHLEVNYSDQIFEFMLNTTRLESPIPLDLFEQKTFVASDRLIPLLKKAKKLNLIGMDEKCWWVTPLGRRFTNNLQEIFLLADR